MKYLEKYFLSNQLFGVIFFMDSETDLTLNLDLYQSKPLFNQYGLLNSCSFITLYVGFV